MRQHRDLAGKMPQLDSYAVAHKRVRSADSGFVGLGVDEVGSDEVPVVSDREGTIGHDEAPG